MVVVDWYEEKGESMEGNVEVEKIKSSTRSMSPVEISDPCKNQQS